MAIGSQMVKGSWEALTIMARIRRVVLLLCDRGEGPRRRIIVSPIMKMSPSLFSMSTITPPWSTSEVLY